MRCVLGILLVLSIFAGSLSQVMMVDPCEPLLAAHAHEHAGHGHDAPCDPDHDRNCPVEHHKSGVCCVHVMPMVHESHTAGTIRALNFSWTSMRGESVIFPEDPVDDMDKPPLI